MRIASPRTLVIGIGMLTLVGFAIPLALADNPGDVKIHDPNQLELQRNDPHVGCSFFVEGFNMDATSGTITFEAWPPTGNMTIVHASGAAETWTADDTNAQGHHHFVSGPYSLPDTHTHIQGTHYKVFVSNDNHDKMKVFWVKCDTVTGGCTEGCQPPCTENCSTTPPTCQETDTCPPTTQVPFFPSATSMVLGVVGAGASVLVALRRRI